MLNRPKRYMNRECLNDEIICWEYMLDYYKDKPYVCDKIERLQYDLRMLGRMGPFAAINYIRHVIGYEEYLKEYAEFRRMNAEDLLEVLNELQESARAYKTYDEWFAYIERYKKEMDEMRKRQQEVKEGVHLATMTAARGWNTIRSLFWMPGGGHYTLQKRRCWMRIWRKNAGCFMWP